MKSMSLVLISLFTVTSFARDRISDLNAKRYQPNPIYLSTGLVSILNFPCEVEMVIVGNEVDAKALISPSDKKIVIVIISRVSAQATNLVAKCQNRKKHFVFDLVPSRTNHQDVVYINTTGFVISKAELMDQSKIKGSTSSIEVKEPKLIRRGGS